MRGSRAGFLFLFYFYLGSSSYTPRAGFIFLWGVSVTHPVLPSFLCGELLLHIPCWLYFSVEFVFHIPYWLNIYVESFSYTSHAGLIFFFFFFLIWGVSLTHPVLALFLSGEFLLHIPVLFCFFLFCFCFCFLFFAFSVRSLCDTSHAFFFCFFFFPLLNAGSLS